MSADLPVSPDRSTPSVLNAWSWLAAGRSFAAALLFALPWLNPFAYGSSAAVQPWLLAAACAMGLWLLLATGGRALRPRLVWPCAAIVAWAVVTQASVRPELVFLAAGLALIVLASGVADDEDIARGMQAGLLAAATLSAAIGLCQYFGFAERLAPWISGAPAGEAFANLRQPNQYASLMWIGAAVLLWAPLRLPFAAAVVLIGLLAVGSAASVSRTAMLQGLVLTGLAAAWQGPQRRRRLLLCAAAAVAYFAATWLLPLLLQLVAGADASRTLWGRLATDAGCGSRTVLWSNVLHLIALKPLAGWGWGNLDYAHFMTLYEGPRFCDILDNAHDLPLHLAVELGVPVAVAVCGAAVVWAWRQRPWREHDPRRQLAWALLAVITLHSLLEYPLWYGPFQLVLGVTLAWLIPAPSPTSAQRLPRLVLAFALPLAAAYALWDYERVTQIYLAPDARRPAWREGTLQLVRESWLFSGPAAFAELTLTPVTPANAARMHAMAEETLRYSPEPRVVEKAIEADRLLGLAQEAALHDARYRAAFPQSYEAWSERQRGVPQSGAKGR